MLLEVHRRITQSLGVLLGHGYLMVFATRAIYDGPLKGLCAPMLSCYACPAAIMSCPIGTLQHYMTIGEVPWLLVGGLVIVGALVGRMTCGWLCPFGLLQDLMYRIPCAKLPVWKPLRFLKYGVLAFGVIVVPIMTELPWFSQLCPAGTLSAGIPWVIWNPTSPASGRPIIANPAGTLFAVKLSILFTLVVLFATMKRPFCRVLCPLGAIFSLFGRFSVVQLSVSSSCQRCNRCQTLCPVDQAVWQAPNSGECVRCLACTRCRRVQVSVAGLSPPAVPARAQAGSE
jgi:ferredoxin-type protein NapH